MFPAMIFFALFTGIFSVNPVPRESLPQNPGERYLR
jgi:hypothetical protein